MPIVHFIQRNPLKIIRKIWPLLNSISKISKYIKESKPLILILLWKIFVVLQTLYGTLNELDSYSIIINIDHQALCNSLLVTCINMFDFDSQNHTIYIHVCLSTHDYANTARHIVSSVKAIFRHSLQLKLYSKIALP